MNRKILALAIPSIITNITTPLLGLVDTAIVGHMGSAIFIAAIAVGGSVFNLLYWCFAFLRMGTSGLTAQANGACDNESINQLLYRSLAVAFVAGIGMIAFSPIILDVMLWFMDVEGDTRALVSEYVAITIWGAPAVLAVYSMSGWFLGMQDSRAPMWISMTVNVANIMVSLILVYQLGWKINGVATGTMASQWIGLIIGIAVLACRYHIRFPDWKKLANLNGVRRFFSINLDIFFRTVCLVAVTLWFTRAGASQGTVLLAVNALLMQMFMLFSYLMDGFAFAGEALVGHYIGAADKSGLVRCVNALFKWGFGVAVIFTVVYFLCGEMILSVLSSQRDVIVISKEYLLWAVSIPLAGFAAFTWDGVFIGATRTREMLWSMMMAVAFFFVVYFSLSSVIGNHALWMAFVMYLMVRGLVLTALGRSLWRGN